MVSLPVRAEALLRLGAQLFQVVPGSNGAPRIGERLAIGVKGASAAEVSSRVTALFTMDLDRAWVVDAVLRAFRNGGDAGWQALLTEQEWERGDEGIDDESGELRTAAQARFYEDYLASKSTARDGAWLEQRHRLPHRIVNLSNDADLEAAILAAAGHRAGAGGTDLPMELLEGALPANRAALRGKVGASIDAMLGAVKRMGPVVVRRLVELPKAA